MNAAGKIVQFGDQLLNVARGRGEPVAIAHRGEVRRIGHPGRAGHLPLAGPDDRYNNHAGDEKQPPLHHTGGADCECRVKLAESVEQSGPPCPRGKYRAVRLSPLRCADDCARARMPRARVPRAARPPVSHTEQCATAFKQCPHESGTRPKNGERWNTRTSTPSNQRVIPPPQTHCSQSSGTPVRASSALGASGGSFARAASQTVLRRPLLFPRFLCRPLHLMQGDVVSDRGRVGVVVLRRGSLPAEPFDDLDPDFPERRRHRLTPS